MNYNSYVKTDDFTFLVISSDRHGRIAFLIDNEDVEKVKKFKWTLLKSSGSGIKSFYAIQSIKSGQLLHRYLLDAQPGSIVDHKNGVTLDMRKQNLFEGDSASNNRGVKRINSVSGVAGVTWDKKSNKWKVQITVDKKQKYLGTYVNLEDAIKARKDAEKEYGFIDRGY